MGESQQELGTTIAPPEVPSPPHPVPLGDQHQGKEPGLGVSPPRMNQRLLQLQLCVSTKTIQGQPSPEPSSGTARGIWGQWDPRAG